MKIETLSVHVGRDVDRRTGEVAPADAPEHHVSSATSTASSRAAIRISRAEQPGTHGARAMHRGAGRRRGRNRVRIGLRRLARGLQPAAARRSRASRRSRPITARPSNCATSSGRWACAAHVRRHDERRRPCGARSRAQTRLVWIETPSNPMLNMSDIETIAELGHGARRAGVLRQHVRDAGLAEAVRARRRPGDAFEHQILRRPQRCDGRRSVTRDRGGLSDKLRDYQETAGSVPSPFDCWLIRRSLTTLACRVRAQTHKRRTIWRSS